uniref:Uncharacterized protein n=1 Tax=Arundo donax TaxID=35708 RepID=A0A0A8ZZV1_ARUDO
MFVVHWFLLYFHCLFNKYTCLLLVQSNSYTTFL